MKYNPNIVLAYFKTSGLPEPMLEFPFAMAMMGRKWRWDFCWVLPSRLALEVQGGIWLRGTGHNTGKALRAEHEKRNAAARLGWRILYVEPKDLCTEETVILIKECLRC